MSKDPIAWLEIGADGIASEYRVLHHSKPNKLDSWSSLIPLYTAPQTISTPQPQTFTGENPFTKTRQLSDVEIHYEVDKWERQNNYKHDADVHKTLIDFARAILKKASEK